MKDLTDFQKKILALLSKNPHVACSRQWIASQVVPEKWKRPQSHAAYVGHVDRACEVLGKDVVIRLDGKDRWDDARWVYVADRK